VGAAPDADERAIRQCNLQAEDIRAGNAVFEATGASRVGGDVTAKGAVLVALGVGRVKKA